MSLAPGVATRCQQGSICFQRALFKPTGCAPAPVAPVTAALGDGASPALPVSAVVTVLVSTIGMFASGMVAVALASSGIASSVSSTDSAGSTLRASGRISSMDTSSTLTPDTPSAPAPLLLADPPLPPDMLEATPSSKKANNKPCRLSEITMATLRCRLAAQRTIETRQGLSNRKRCRMERPSIWRCEAAIRIMMHDLSGLNTLKAPVPPTLVLPYFTKKILFTAEGKSTVTFAGILRAGHSEDGAGRTTFSV